MDGSNEKIEVAVAVDVAERRTATPVSEIDTRLHCYVDKRSIALILVKAIRFGIAAHNVEINITVSVVVGCSDTATCAVGFR